MSDQRAKKHNLLFLMMTNRLNLITGFIGFSFFFKVYEVKDCSGVMEKINSLVSKALEPLHPHVEESRPKNIKHLSHTFSRDKQHL